MSSRTEMANRWNPRDRPPNIPGGYGSRLYPTIQPDDIPDGMPVYRQLQSRNFTRMSLDEHCMEFCKDERAVKWGRENRGRRPGRKPYCDVCSVYSTWIKEKPTPVYHVHNSSKQNRLRMMLDGYGQYHCNTCEISPHPYESGKRTAIYISSSTLNNWHGDYMGNIYKGDPFHLDYITVPGATIEELHQAFACEYQNYWHSMDVVLCAGLNNLLKGQKVRQIQTELRDFKHYVMSLNNATEFRFDNTFGVCTLPYPPKLSRLQLDPHPGPGFWDRTWDIRDINEYIQDLNDHGEERVCTRRAPQFHTFGIVKGENFGRGNRLGSLNMHRDANWREPEFYDKLHLNNWMRLKMGKAVCSYYEYIYEIKINKYITREEQQEAYEGQLRMEARKQKEEQHKKELKEAQNRDICRGRKRMRAEMEERERKLVKEVENYRAGLGGI